MKDRQNSLHNMVVESLTEAMLLMLEKKPLQDINVSELCEKAGVSRISFYRNFKSKEEILVRHLSDTTDSWWSEFSKKKEQDFYRDFWPELLQQYRKNKDLIMLLYKNNVSYLIKEHIFFCCEISKAHTETEAYMRAALAGALYGVVDEWIRRGMDEMPVGLSLRDMLNAMPKEEYFRDENGGIK